MFSLLGKKMFSRTNVRKVAEKRKQPLDEYCRVSLPHCTTCAASVLNDTLPRPYLQQLIRLPPKISDSPFVLDFFEVTEDDLSPIK